jgi:hypothetical protein
MIVTSARVARYVIYHLFVVSYPIDIYIALSRPRCRWVDNIKIDLREIGWDGVDWIDMARDRGPVEGSCEHGIETSGSIKCWGVLERLQNWRLLKKGSALSKYRYILRWFCVFWFIVICVVC